MPEVVASEERLANLIVVHVYLSNMRQYYLARLGPEDGVFIRVGSTNRNAEAPQIEEFGDGTGQSRFDERVIPGLNSKPIALRAAAELLALYRQQTLRVIEHAAHHPAQSRSPVRGPSVAA